MKQFIANQWNALPLRLRNVLRGCFVAAEGAVAGFLAQLLFDPEPVCFTRLCFRHYVGAIVVSVAVAVRNYLKASPETLALREQK